MKNIIIDNLPCSTTESELRDLFAPYGDIHSATVVRGTSLKARGLAFVSMDPQDAWHAIRGLDGLELEGRILCVQAAQPTGRPQFGIHDTSPSW